MSGHMQAKTQALRQTATDSHRADDGYMNLQLHAAGIISISQASVRESSMRRDRGDRNAGA